MSGLLYPYEFLIARSLDPRNRYLQYANYADLLATVYGQSLVTAQQMAATTAELHRISDALRHDEAEFFRICQDQGLLQRMLQESAQGYSLEQLGLGPDDVPAALPGYPATASHARSHNGATSRENKVHPSKLPAPASNSYMPRFNAVQPQASAHLPHQGPTKPLQAYHGAGIGTDSPSLNFPPTSLSDSRGQGAPAALPQARSTFTGHDDTPKIGLDATASPEQRSSSYIHRREPMEQKGNSQSPIVIDDDNERPEQTKVFQRSDYLNPPTKRVAASLQHPQAKVARTSSYVQPVDLTGDATEDSATPLNTPGPTPTRQNFDGSENFAMYDSFKEKWEKDKETVEGSKPGRLPNALNINSNRGIFKYSKAWMAFGALDKRRQEEKDRAKQMHEEKERMIQASRERERERKRNKREAEQKRKADDRKATAQKARQEARRQEREKEATKTARSKQQKQQQTAVLQREPSLSSDAESTLFVPEKSPEQDAQADSQFQCASFSSSDELVALFDEGIEQEEAEEESAQEAVNTSPDSFSTGGKSEDDDDDLSSLFGDDADEKVSLSASPADHQEVKSSNPSIPPESVAIDTAAGTPLVHSKSPEKANSVTEPAIDEVPTPREVVQTKSSNDESPSGDGSDSEEEVEEDPEIAAKRAEIQALDKEIAENSSKLSSNNALFKGRVEKHIKELELRKDVLISEIDGGL